MMRIGRKRRLFALDEIWVKPTYLVPGPNRAAVNRLPSLSAFEVNSSAAL